MDSQKYFDRMRETSKIVDETIYDILDPLRQEIPEMYDAVRALPEKRKGLPKSRAHLAREAYTLCKGREDNGWIPLATAVELELNSMYYKNQVFDEKASHSLRNKERAFGNWLADSYSRDLAGRLLQESYQDKPQVSGLLRKANIVCAEGFWIDIFDNTYQQTRNLTFNEQIALCDERMYKMNASFFEKIATMGAMVANESDSSKISSLSDFGRAYGMGLQSVNDIADFVPPRINSGTTEKTGNDAYSDVKHGKMTYPIIWLLENGSAKDKRVLEEILETGQEAKLPQLEKLTRVLVRSGAINFAKQKVKVYRNQAKHALHKAFSKNERKYLSTMCTMFDKNRYYEALKKVTEEVITK